MRLRPIALGIVLLMICMALPNISPIVDPAKADNLAGDLDQLPENETMFDLKGGIIRFGPGTYSYNKNNTIVCGFNNYADKLFDGTHQSCEVSIHLKIIFYFPFSLKITKVRVYPMDENGTMDVSNVIIGSHYYSVPGLGAHYIENSELSTAGINSKTDYLEFVFPDLVIPDLFVQFVFSGGIRRINEVEIYYDKTFNPYPAVGQAYYNTTNITNEYNNEYNNDTYINDTYINETYINNTYTNDTYVNETRPNAKEYQIEGDYTPINYQNFTNVNNQTDQTIGEMFYNTTNEYVNYTYLNETIIQDNKILENKLNDVWKQLNETKGGGEEIKESKSLADKTYSDPILIILLLAILVIQIFLFLQRKRGKEQEQSTRETTIEPEIKYAPSPDFTREGEVDIISRNFQQEQAPPEQFQTQYFQYGHRPPDQKTRQQAQVQTPPPAVSMAPPQQHAPVRTVSPPPVPAAAPPPDQPTMIE